MRGHGLRRTLPAIVTLLAVGAALAGCAATNNPFQKPHTWHEAANGGAVMYDMRAEIANPHDLLKGHGPKRPGTYGGTLAVKAVGNMGNGGFGGGGGYGGYGGGFGGGMNSMGGMGGVGGGIGGGMGGIGAGVGTAGVP